MDTHGGTHVADSNKELTGYSRGTQGVLMGTHRVLTGLRMPASRAVSASTAGLCALQHAAQRTTSEIAMPEKATPEIATPEIAPPERTTPEIATRTVSAASHVFSPNGSNGASGCGCLHRLYTSRGLGVMHRLHPLGVIRVLHRLYPSGVLRVLYRLHPSGVLGVLYRLYPRGYSGYSIGSTPRGVLRVLYRLYPSRGTRGTH